MNETPLGQLLEYANQYDAVLLCPVPRAESRALLGLAADLPVTGCDLWTAWAISWLNPAGNPQIASAALPPYILGSPGL